MARPRKASDEEVYAAALRAMSRLSPHQLTLAEIAAEAGLTAGALVQRFGSKRGLQVRMAADLAAATGGIFQDLRRRHRSALAVLRAYGECMAGMAESPAALARNFAYLQIDLTDPDLRKHLVAQARATRRELESLVAESIAAGEMRPGTDAAMLARSLEAMVSGALLTWAFHVEGSAAAWVRAHVDALLLPHLTRGPAASVKAPRRRGGRRS